MKSEVKNAHVDALVEAIARRRDARSVARVAETLAQLASLEAPVLGEERLGDAFLVRPC